MTPIFFFFLLFPLLSTGQECPSIQCVVALFLQDRRCGIEENPLLQSSELVVGLSQEASTDEQRDGLFLLLRSSCFLMIFPDGDDSFIPSFFLPSYVMSRPIAS